MLMPATAISRATVRGPAARTARPAAAAPAIAPSVFGSCIGS